MHPVYLHKVHKVEKVTWKKSNSFQYDRGLTWKRKGRKKKRKLYPLSIAKDVEAIVYCVEIIWLFARSKYLPRCSLRQ